MSAILKTLKKLEEEKALFTQSLDIEEMVTQVEVTAPSVTRSRKVGIIATLLSLTAGLLTAHFIYQSNKPERPVAPPSIPQAAPPVSAVSASAVPASAVPAKKQTSGIPLARIPETASSIPNPADQQPSAKNPPPTVTKVKDSPALASLREINTLIENAKLAADLERANPSPVKPRSNGVYISGLKIKGIVYLTENNPVNHIFVSTPDASNLKLRVGQKAQGATLKAIHPDKAVFHYRGQISEISVGE